MCECMRCAISILTSPSSLSTFIVLETGRLSFSPTRSQVTERWCSDEEEPVATHTNSTSCLSSIVMLDTGGLVMVGGTGRGIVGIAHCALHTVGLLPNTLRVMGVWARYSTPEELLKAERL